MSLRTSFVLVEGDHRRDVERFLAQFGYTFAVVPRTVPSFSAASKTTFQWQVSPTVVKKAVGYVRGWTTIYDPERVLAGEPDALRRLSRMARSTVFALVCDGTSGAFGYTLVRGGSLRARHASGSTTVLDLGVPVPEELGLPHDPLGEEEVNRVLERVAFPLAALDESGTWQVLTLESHEERHAASAGRSAVLEGESSRKRHWWRFW
jgi:hypothetical protein